MSMKSVIALGLAAAMLTLTACSGTQEESVQTAAPAGVAVQVEQVAVRDVSTDNRVSGKVVSDNEHTVMVAATAKCTAVHVRAGDTVKAGDKLCTLDLASTLAQHKAASISYQSLLKQYNDQKDILDRQIAMAQDNVNNLKALYEIGAASRLEIDSAELQLSQALAGRDSGLAQIEAGIQNGKSGLEQLELVLENVDSRGNVVSPADGVVSALNVVENGFVSSSMPVAVVDGADVMKVTVSVSEALVPKLVIGDEANVSVPAAEADFIGTVRSVERTANLQTKLYTVTLNVPAEAAGLMSGMFADVTFHTETVENTVVIPSQAILTSAGKQFVFVVEGDTARQVEITTGLTGTGITQITSGLTGGETLVVVGQSYLSDGDPVRVVSGEV